MAYSKWLRKGLRFGCAGVLVFAITCPVSLSQAEERAHHKRHYLSHESVNRPEEYRKIRKLKGSHRRFKLKREFSTGLKRGYFMSTHPYQFATPLVDSNRIYVGVDSGRFYSLDASNGKRFWEFEAKGPIHSKAAIADGVIYVADAKAQLYAIDAANGAKRWSALLDTESLAAPAVSGSAVFVATLSGRIYSIDRTTGVERWHTDPSERGIGFSVRRSSVPVISGGTIYIGSSSGLVMALSETDGRIQWVRQLGSKRSQFFDVDCMPLIVGNSLFIASADGSLFNLNPKSGEPIWESDIGGSNDLVIANNALFVSAGGVLYSVDPSNGMVRWEQDLETAEISSPASGNGVIVIASTGDKLYLIDSTLGDVLLERFLGKGAYGDPVVVGDKLYILTNTAKLISYTIKELPPKKVKIKETNQRVLSRRSNDAKTVDQ